MKTTAAALRELQDYFDSIDPRPNVREIAKMANLPYSTAARYLNGTTKQGLPDTVRALAHALGRDDIMEEVVSKTPTSNSDAWWIVELQREYREANLEELNQERQLRKESEARFEKTLADKDEHIRQLVSRIAKLEENNGKLAAAHAHSERRRTKYEIVALILLVALGLYFIVFDLPHPEYGITEVLIDLFKGG